MRTGYNTSWGEGISIRTLPKDAYLSVACSWNQLCSYLQAEPTPVYLVGGDGIKILFT